MQLEFRNNKDVWAGAMLIATGTVAMVMARDYAFGTTLRMGPGYFPTVLGGLLILFGLYLVAMGLRRNEKIVGSWSLRALVVPGALWALQWIVMIPRFATPRKEFNLENQ